MDPFAPQRSYGRRPSSSQDRQDPRTLAGHPLYAPATGGLPPPIPFGSNRGSSFGSSSGGMHRLPSPGDALRGPDRFEHSLDLPPLQTIPRSTSPLLGRPSNRRGYSDLPSLGSLESTGFGNSSLGSGGGRYGSATTDALTDSFAMPPPRPSLRRRSSRSGSLSMTADERDQHGSLPSFSDFSNFPASGQLGGHFGTGFPTALEDPFSSTAEEGAGDHTSRNLRKFSKRATFSQAQLNIMEDLWARTEYPSNDQIEACASATGLLAKQVRTWFGNTRQARLAGTRREARHAPIPGQPGTGTANRRGRGDTASSLYRSLGAGSGSGSGPPPLSSFGNFPPLGPLDPGSGFSSMSSSMGGNYNFPSTLGPLPSIASYYEPNSSGMRSSGGQGPLFPPLDPLPVSLGGTGGLLPGFGPSSSSGQGGGSSGSRSQRRSTTSYPSMNYDHGLPPPSKRY